MDNSVVNVGAFAGKDVRESLVRAARVREAALTICYSIEGYEALPLDDRNAIYDKVAADVADMMRGERYV